MSGALPVEVEALLREAWLAALSEAECLRRHLSTRPLDPHETGFMRECSAREVLERIQKYRAALAARPGPTR